MDEPSGHRVRLVAFLLFTMASFLIRPVAVILFIAAIIHLVFFRRRFGYAAVTAAALLSAIAVESLLGASSGNYLHIYLSKGVWEILNRLQAQFIYVFEQIIIFFFAGRPLSFPILWLPLLMMCAVGIFEDGEQGKTIDLLGIFTLLYLIVILLFPAKQGPRYIFPLVAPVLIYVLRTLGYVAGHWKERGLAKTVINAFLILGLIYNVCATVHRRDYTDDQALQPEAREMTQWVKNNVSPTEHYLCWDPRAMAFLTGRIGMGLPAGAEEVARLCRSENLRWVMLIEGLQDKLISELKQAAGFVDAWHNERYRIFKYCPDQDADPIYSRE
jgi:hypothetical protein